MQGENAYQTAAAARTRYVFAGTQDSEQGAGTKTCPRCGQVLFEDMDVCFGCLYDFSRDRKSERDGARGYAPNAEGRAKKVLVPKLDPLDDIELDEIDEDEPSIEKEAQVAARVPRHRKPPIGSPEDTLDLGPVSTSPDWAGKDTASPCLVELSSPDVRVSLSVPDSGLTIGRDEGNDVVLRSPAVSRLHMRIVMNDAMVFVEDCGATNPALLDGLPLRGRQVLAPGSEVVIGDAVFSLP